MSMKNSHLTTPRNLSDCTFEVGHVEATLVSHALTYFLTFLGGFVSAWVCLLWLGL